jgi:NtrC-family two-component system sensor histidine kinase KinB
VAVDQARLAEEARRIRQLEEMDRLKGEFVAVASHELRSPITSLVMEVELLRERLAATLDQRNGQLLEAAVEDARRLRALVDDLLDLSKLEAGRVVLHRSSVAVESLLEQATSAFRVRAEEQGLELSAESAPDLPPVSADPKQVARVFANLLANAIRFTRPAAASWWPPTRSASSSSSRSPTTARVSRSRINPGSSTASAHLDRQRGQGQRPGLAISREIVRAHGGDIWVDSGPGPGAVFSFTLPVSRNGDAPSPPTNDSDA